MKNILNDLYYGKLSGWERRPVRTVEFREINSKIESEKQYFVSKMSLDDCQRFQALENLYSQSHSLDEFDAYCAGVKFAVMLMSAVFMSENRGEK